MIGLPLFFLYASASLLQFSAAIFRLCFLSEDTARCWRMPPAHKLTRGSVQQMTTIQKAAAEVLVAVVVAEKVVCVTCRMPCWYIIYMAVSSLSCFYFSLLLSYFFCYGKDASAPNLLCRPPMIDFHPPPHQIRRKPGTIFISSRLFLV